MNWDCYYFFLFILASFLRIVIFFRADIDALQMEQLNHDLPYLSKNKGAAHMCGHDGHTACLVGFVPLFLK